MTAEEALADAVWAYAEAAQELDKATAAIDDCDVAVVVAALAAVRAATTQARQCDGSMERRIAAVFKAEGWSEDRAFDGVGQVEVRRSTARRGWDHDTLARDWLAAWMAKRGGVMPDPGEVVRAFRNAAQVNGWKVGETRALGLNVNDYCDTEPGPPVVRIVTGGKR